MTRKRRRDKYITPTSIAVTIATVVALGVLAAVMWYVSALRPAGSDTREVLVPIRPSGMHDLAQVLGDRGLIRSKTAFRLMAKSRIALQADSPKAGAYDLSPSMSADEIWQRICSGKVARRRVTFPEGFTIAQMADRVAERLAIPAEEFMAAARGGEVDRNVGFRLPAGSLEGYLFPSTYDFPAGGDAGQIVGEMVATLQKVFVARHESAIAARGLSLHGIITLASLVEREARAPAERARIAGVLQNRLDRGMRLECDATVQYALGKHRSRLLYRDLKAPSPYNTYLHAGLPPGPICNPGLACLEAALKPAATEALFYVARPDGSHVFSRTYEEHLQAIRRIRGR